MRDLFIAICFFAVVWGFFWAFGSKPTEDELAQIKDCDAWAPVVDLDSDNGKRIYYSFMVQCLPDVYPPKAHMKAWLDDN